jgi:hypothetical protein
VPINDATYNETATRGDVAGVAINISIGLSAVAEALSKLSSGGTPTTAEIKEIQDTAVRLSEKFDRLSGWTK